MIGSVESIEYELALRRGAQEQAAADGVDLPAEFVAETQRLQDLLGYSDQDCEVSAAQVLRPQPARKRCPQKRRATRSQLGYLNYLARKSGAQIPRGRLDSRKAAWLIDRLEKA